MTAGAGCAAGAEHFRSICREGGCGMTKAIVLINTEPGRDQKVAKELKKVKGVEGVSLVSGLYDLVATVRGDTSEDILRIVYDQVRVVGGVRSSHTMFCLEL